MAWCLAVDVSSGGGGGGCPTVKSGGRKSDKSRREIKQIKPMEWKQPRNMRAEFHDKKRRLSPKRRAGHLTWQSRSVTFCALYLPVEVEDGGHGGMTGRFDSTVLAQLKPLTAPSLAIEAMRSKMELLNMYCAGCLDSVPCELPRHQMLVGNTLEP